ncbi:ATP-binding protein [Chloroflexota bacterium]
MPVGIGAKKPEEHHPTEDILKKDPKKMTDEELYKAVAWKIKKNPDGEEGYYRNSRYLPLIFERMLRGREDAYVLLALPGNPSEIAEKTGLSEKEVEDRLKILGDKAIAWKTSKGWFMPRSMVGQLHDAAVSVTTYHDEYGEEFFYLWDAYCNEEYYLDPNYSPWLRHGLTDQQKRSRIIPDRRALAEGLELAPWEDMRVIFEMMNQEDNFGAITCSCCLTRPGAPHWDYMYHCMISGRVFEYWTSKLPGKDGKPPIKKLTVDEAMALLEECHEQGIVSRIPNGKNLSNLRQLCTCHVDYCDGMRPGLLKGISLREQYSPSRYFMNVKSIDDCQACQKCVEVCFWGAAQLKKITPPGAKWAKDALYKAWVDPELCMGCGNCGLICPAKNRELVLVKNPEHIPDEPAAMGM